VYTCRAFSIGAGILQITANVYTCRAYLIGEGYCNLRQICTVWRQDEKYEQAEEAELNSFPIDCGGDSLAPVLIFVVAVSTQGLNKKFG
jgi:hypothetical protein